MEIKVPKALDYRAALSFATDLGQLAADNEYVFDFEELKWSPPFSLLVVSCAIRRLANRVAPAKVYATNYKNHSYQGHMGFFRAFGLDFGKQPGEATGSKNYLPITMLREQALYASAQPTEHLGDIIERHARRLAEMLTRSSDEVLIEILTYALREMIRNVFEHSESDHLEYCAQYWPTLNKVEIALMDTGIGIPKSIAQNKTLQINTDFDSLKFALLPGISRKPIPPKAQIESDPWTNTGYGLFVTSSLCRMGGEFVLSSGSATIKLKGKTRTRIKLPFSGTAVRLVLTSEQIPSLKSVTESLLAEARDIVKDLGGQATISASMASSMLSRDFGRPNKKSS